MVGGREGLGLVLRLEACCEITAHLSAPRRRPAGEGYLPIV